MGLHRFSGDLQGDLHGFARAKGELIGCQSVEGQPHREHVRTTVEGASQGLFGGHVGGRALQLALGGGVGYSIGEQGDAEVADLHLTIDGYHDVAGLHVAVNQVEQGSIGRFQLVRGMDSLAGSGQHLDDRSYLSGTPGLSSVVEHSAHGDPVDKVHDHVDPVFLFDQVENPEHIRVVDSGSDSRLVDQHLDDTWMGFEQPLVDQLQSDVILEPMRALLNGVVDGCHSAATDLVENSIASQPLRCVVTPHWESLAACCFQCLASMGQCSPSMSGLGMEDLTSSPELFRLRTKGALGGSL